MYFFFDVLFSDFSGKSLGEFSHPYPFSRLLFHNKRNRIIKQSDAYPCTVPLCFKIFFIVKLLKIVNCPDADASMSDSDILLLFPYRLDFRTSLKLRIPLWLFLSLSSDPADRREKNPPKSMRGGGRT